MLKSLLSNEWINQLNHYEKLWVGFSGGLDSTLLLYVLDQFDELKPKLSAIHINHGLSKNALYWQSQCQKICETLKIPLVVETVSIAGFSNLEEKARIARYIAFSKTIIMGHCLLLGHHQDDQAETVLLNLMRGAGIDGIAGMEPISHRYDLCIARPFLKHSKQLLEKTALEYQIEWIEDDSNQNTNFNRNFLRHTVFPLLESKWPQAKRNLAKAAHLCAEAQKSIRHLVSNQFNNLSEKHLNVQDLISLREDEILTVLRAWLLNHSVLSPSQSILKEILHSVIYARDDANPLVKFNEIVIHRYQGQLFIMPDKELGDLNTNEIIWETFPNPILLPVFDSVLHAYPAAEGFVLKDQDTLRVRFRQGGEQIKLKRQNKALKKLFQEWKIPPWQRDKIPLIYSNEVLAAIVGYAVSDDFYGTDKAFTFGLAS